MREQTKHEIQLGQLRKVIVSAIRLKHSLAADEEIKTRGAELYAKAEQSLLAGQPLTLLAAEILDAQ